VSDLFSSAGVDVPKGPVEGPDGMLRYPPEEEPLEETDPPIRRPSEVTPADGAEASANPRTME